MGTPAFAAAVMRPLMAAGHQIAAVVTRPDAPAGRGLTTHPGPVKQLARAHDIPVLQPAGVRGPDLPAQARALSPDIVVVVAFGRILPQTLLEVAPLGAVNLHASLLPRYRGAAPVAWAIARGEAVTGVTTMRMVERLDAGDILLQRSTPIGPAETAGDLEQRLAGLGADLMIETLAGLAAGSITPRPQEEAAATYAPILKKQDGLIDWTRSAGEIARLVRAFDPWPVASTGVTGAPGRTLRIWKARPLALSRGGEPEGAVVKVVKDPRSPGAEAESGVIVACGEGTLLLVTEIQPAGRKRMTAIEAVSGRHMKEGDQLG